MAFSETQRDQIRQYLGYPAAFRDQTYQLESMMDTVGANAVEQASVEAILAELVTIDETLAGEGASTATYGDLKRVDEVEFYSTAESGSDDDSVGAMKRGRMLIRRLSQRFGVPPRDDYFGASGIRSFETMA